MKKSLTYIFIMQFLGDERQITYTFNTSVSPSPAVLIYQHRGTGNMNPALGPKENTKELSLVSAAFIF